MPKHKTIELLEQGDIYFLYRPKVQTENETEATPQKSEDIQRFYMVLHPQDTDHYRLFVIGRKHLPEVKEYEKAWATVETVTKKPQDLIEALKATHYQTKIRGKRLQPEARACGEGVYSIAKAGKNTYLVYSLELPNKLSTVQHEFNIATEASYILSVKNQAVAGTQSGKSADYPKSLQAKLGDLRFAPVNDLKLLDYAGAELLLIGTSTDITDAMDTHLEPTQETSATADLFTQLKLWKNEHTTKPLLEGKWA